MFILSTNFLKNAFIGYFFKIDIIYLQQNDIFKKILIINQNLNHFIIKTSFKLYAFPKYIP